MAENKKCKKRTIICGTIALVICAFLILCFTVLVPMHNIKKASMYLETAHYPEALSILEKEGNRNKSSGEKVISALDAFFSKAAENKDYEGIIAFVNLYESFGAKFPENYIFDGIVELAKEGKSKEALNLIELYEGLHKTVPADVKSAIRFSKITASYVGTKTTGDRIDSSDFKAYGIYPDGTKQEITSFDISAPSETYTPGKTVTVQVSDSKSGLKTSVKVTCPKLNKFKYSRKELCNKMYEHLKFVAPVNSGTRYKMELSKNDSGIITCASFRDSIGRYIFFLRFPNTETEDYSYVSVKPNVVTGSISYYSVRGEYHNLKCGLVGFTGGRPKNFDETKENGSWTNNGYVYHSTYRPKSPPYFRNDKYEFSAYLMQEKVY